MIGEDCTVLPILTFIAGVGTKWLWSWLSLRKSDEIASRKEDKDDIDAIKNKISDIEVKAVAHHTKRKRNGASVEEITSAISCLWDELKMVRSIEASHDSEQIYLSFKRAITMDNFDSGKHVKQEPKSEIVKRIRDDARLFRNLLDDIFSEKYPRGS
ncbi:MAG: hypothetical protein GY822_21340 [Deltaproteobacteria bacterium]|nr:hypothetical protein [Deltaproteobacteria bacterium]